METQKEKDINRKRQKMRKTKMKIKESDKLRMWERYENKNVRKVWERNRYRGERNDERKDRNWKRQIQWKGKYKLRMGEKDETRTDKSEKGKDLNELDMK